MPTANRGRRGLLLFALCAAVVAGCGGVTGGESSSGEEVPLEQPDVGAVGNSQSREDVPRQSELEWLAYPAEAGALVAELLPSLRVARDVTFLNGPTCNYLRLTSQADKWRASAPEELSPAALEANVGMPDYDLFDALAREATAHSRHCDAVMAAEERFQSARVAISNSPLRTLNDENIARQGADALIDQSFYTYLDETPLVEWRLRITTCVLAKKFPSEADGLFDALLANWRQEIGFAYDVLNLEMLETYGFALGESDWLAGQWIAEEWGDDDNFVAWLCPSLADSQG